MKSVTEKPDIILIGDDCSEGSEQEIVFSYAHLNSYAECTLEKN